MMTVRDRLIFLHQCPNVTRSMLRRMFQHDPSLLAMFNYSIEELSMNYQLSAEKATCLFYELKQMKSNEWLDSLKPFHVWTFVDSDYPIALSLIPDPPLVLYGLGKKEILHAQPPLAVVGTRHPSSKAKRHMFQILKPLVDEKWVFVSGLACGIDGLAHRLSHYYKGKTIAVVAGGLNHPYPKQHIALFHQLTTHHLVISEYPPNIKPQRYHFPERNRIISGLSFATLVIEAKEKSGSLITVNQALEQGRHVFAVPGSISDEQSLGCLRMIQSGATLVIEAQDLINEWEQTRQNWVQMLEENTEILN
ncbi:DNA processing protein [Pelagirhabdus alkalitolerans]|uniref:DNA processing protein n=1 Tax=Pelagirhabdus alkalitolerans TaxID=1612202 RepID=A0A1G6H2S4_9BACI|nr:DNA-processing protein DprA [Pelagirhabdus alkalitolerans]SDB88501.1 DNA processing protein [Pelagirhabdus alkalitolerans]